MIRVVAIGHNSSRRQKLIVNFIKKFMHLFLHRTIRLCYYRLIPILSSLKWPIRNVNNVKQKKIRNVCNFLLKSEKTRYILNLDNSVLFGAPIICILSTQVITYVRYFNQNILIL